MADRSDCSRAAPEPDSPEVLRLFEEHLDLADRLARRYERPGTADDVRQVARLGLLLAARRFEPEAGVFVRFATVTIIGELKKHLRRTDWSLHVPRALQEDALRVTAAIDELTGRLGRTPAAAEVAAHLGVSTECVVEALHVRASRRSAELSVGERVAHEEHFESAALVAQAMAALDPAQQDLIRLRYGEGLSQAEIGARIGVSQPQVHRRLASALERMRHQIEGS